MTKQNRLSSAVPSLASWPWEDRSFSAFPCLFERIHVTKSWLLTEHIVLVQTLVIANGRPAGTSNQFIWSGCGGGGFIESTPGSQEGWNPCTLPHRCLCKESRAQAPSLLNLCTHLERLCSFLRDSEKALCLHAHCPPFLLLPTLAWVTPAYSPGHLLTLSPRCRPFTCFHKILHRTWLRLVIACLLVCFPAGLWPSREWELCLIHASILCSQPHS